MDATLIVARIGFAGSRPMPSWHLGGVSTFLVSIHTVDIVLSCYAPVLLSDDDPYARMTMIATWVNAVAAGLTVLLVSAGSVVAYRVYKVESERDRRADVDRRSRDREVRAGQAAKISIWVQYGSNVGGSEVVRLMLRAGDDAALDAMRIVVQNSSELPIYEIEYYMVQVPRSKLDPIIVDPYLQVDSSHYVLPPGQHIFEVAGSTGSLADMLFVRVAISFRDAAGFWWQRDIGGVLTQVTEDEVKAGRFKRMPEWLRHA